MFEISLDHDLGNECNGTGYDVAKWIEQMAFAKSQDARAGLPQIRWAVHSQHPVGVSNTIQALRSAEWYWALQADSGDGNRNYSALTQCPTTEIGVCLELGVWNLLLLLRIPAVLWWIQGCPS